MNKAFTMFLWENAPSINTPLSENFLNKVNGGLNEVDNRVVTMSTTKAEQADLLTALADVEFDENTGVITFIKKNGSQKTIDTKLEKLAINFRYDKDSQQLIITLDDGTYQYVDMSALITELEFQNSNTVIFSVTNGKVSANIVKGSITADMIEPNYLAKIKKEADTATAKAQEASNSAAAAATSATNAANSATSANNSANSATNSAASASESATSARANATSASDFATSASNSATSAATSAANAKTSETNASTSATNAASSANTSSAKASEASASATNAKTSETNAKTSESNAKTSEVLAKQHADYAEGAVDEINKKLKLATFSLDSDGNLVYTDDSAYIFTVDENGMLNYSVA